MEKDTLTQKQAEKVLLIRKGMVHTFYNTSFGLIGGDHSLSSIKRDLKNAYLIKKTGEHALNMEHGLVIVPKKECKQSDLLFVETIAEFNEEELKKIKKK